MDIINLVFIKIIIRIHFTVSRICPVRKINLAELPRLRAVPDPAHPICAFWADLAAFWAVGYRYTLIR